MLLNPDQRKRCEDRIAAARSPPWMHYNCGPETLRRLGDAERAACDRRMLSQYAKGAEHPVDPIPAEKRAYYDAVQAAYRSLHDYGAPTPYRKNGELLWTAPGRLPGLGCAIPFGAPKGYKSQKPPHSLKLGPLPCYITPPQGFGTEEAGIPPP